MPFLDFDMALAARIGDIYPSPGITIEFMPEELFERKRIVDKLTNEETFDFISFWRSGFQFDVDRWSPADMFYSNEGYYNDPSMTTATTFNLFPVKYDYSFIFWHTKREHLDYFAAYLFKSLYKNPVMPVQASDHPGLLMNCYMDFEYNLKITDEYVLEKSEKVPYFKGKFEMKLEGWLYDAMDVDVIHFVHTFTYNEHNYYFGDIWVPYPDSGYESGESGLPSGALSSGVDAEDVEVVLV